MIEPCVLYCIYQQYAYSLNLGKEKSSNFRYRVRDHIILQMNPFLRPAFKISFNIKTCELVYSVEKLYPLINKCYSYV